MEKIIYILAPIIYFLYQGYQNYLKEQEKAKKRNAGMPEGYGDVPQEVNTKPVVVKEVRKVESKPSYRPVTKEAYVKQKREEVVYEKLSANDNFKDYYNPEKTESINSKKSKASQKVNTVLEYNEDSVEYHEFNLRDAIIKEAILNRPYK